MNFSFLSFHVHVSASSVSFIQRKKNPFEWIRSIRIIVNVITFCSLLSYDRNHAVHLSLLTSFISSLFKDSEHKYTDPAGTDRGMTLAPHPAEVRGSWGREGDSGPSSPWRKDRVRELEVWYGDGGKGKKEDIEDKKRRNHARKSERQRWWRKVTKGNDTMRYMHINRGMVRETK